MPEEIAYFKNLENVVRQIPHLSDGWITVQKSLLIKLHKLQNEDTEEEKSDDMNCPRCFTRWNKGQYTVQSKTKSTIRRKKLRNMPLTKRFMMECLVCSYKKYIYHSYQQPTYRSISKKIENKKRIRAGKKFEQKENNWKTKVKSNNKIAMKSKSKQRGINMDTREDNIEKKENSKIVMKLKQKQKNMETKEYNAEMKENMKIVMKLQQKEKNLETKENYTEPKENSEIGMKLKQKEKNLETKENNIGQKENSEIGMKLKQKEKNLETKENNIGQKKNSKMGMKLKQKEKNLEIGKKTKTEETFNQKQNYIKTKDKLKKVKKLKQSGNSIKSTKRNGKMKEKKRILTFLKDFIQ